MSTTMTKSENFGPVRKRQRCSCAGPLEFGDDRHAPDCPCAPELSGWLFYPHDGELENGGVYVHPTRKARIYLLVRDRLVAADHKPPAVSRHTR